MQELVCQPSPTENLGIEEESIIIDFFYFESLVRKTKTWKSSLWGILKIFFIWFLP